MSNTIYGGTTTTPVPLVITDQNYNPESENAQSGIAVAEAIEGLGNSWQKIVDITTAEEANGIMATIEEFPDLANCKEFIARIIYQPSATGTQIELGAARLDFNNRNQVIFRFGETKISTGIAEHRCQWSIADNLIYSTGTHSLAGFAVVTAEIKGLVGSRTIQNVTDITYYLNEKDAVIPIGTKLEIYGKKVEIGESAEAILNKKLGDIETLLGGI